MAEKRKLESTLKESENKERGINDAIESRLRDIHQRIGNLVTLQTSSKQLCMHVKNVMGGDSVIEIDIDMITKILRRVRMHNEVNIDADQVWLNTPLLSDDEATAIKIINTRKRLAVVLAANRDSIGILETSLDAIQKKNVERNKGIRSRLCRVNTNVNKLLAFSAQIKKLSIPVETMTIKINADMIRSIRRLLSAKIDFAADEEWLNFNISEDEYVGPVDGVFTQTNMVEVYNTTNYEMKVTRNKLVAILSGIRKPITILQTALDSNNTRETE